MTQSNAGADERALVATDGWIDWLCFPRFDSPAMFTALLGTEENGRWQIAPSDPDYTITRKYRDGTLILKTEFRTAAGAVTLVDFMPPEDGVASLMPIQPQQSKAMPFTLTDQVACWREWKT